MGKPGRVPAQSPLQPRRKGRTRLVTETREFYPTTGAGPSYASALLFAAVLLLILAGLALKNV